MKRQKMEKNVYHSFTEYKLTHLNMILLDQPSKNPNVQWKNQQILTQEIRVFSTLCT